MMQCEYCDYYRKMSGKDHGETGAGAFCSFADVMLDTGPERQDAGYPCRDMSYQAYQNKERTPMSTSKLKAEYWKFAYRNLHPMAERRRPKIACKSM